MEPSSNNKYAFLSYKRPVLLSDKPYLERLLDRLRGDGLREYFDLRSLLLGEGDLKNNQNHYIYIKSGGSTRNTNLIKQSSETRVPQSTLLGPEFVPKSCVYLSNNLQVHRHNFHKQYNSLITLL